MYFTFSRLTVSAMYAQEKNNLAEIAVVSGCLGAVFGLSIIAAVFRLVRLPVCIYLVALSLFHFNEFDCSFRYQPSKVTSKSFLVYGSGGNWQYWVIQLMTLAECWANYRLQWLGTRKFTVLLTVCGVIMVVAGLSFRRLAMKTCGESFSHYINTKNFENQVLVTHGVYSVSRHPSYVGFYLIVVGTQLLLQNMVSLLICIVILHVFFKKRIAFEEWFLVNRIFGPQYVEYQNRVPILLPFI